MCIHETRHAQKDHPSDMDGKELPNGGFHNISEAFVEFPRKAGVMAESLLV